MSNSSLDLVIKPSEFFQEKVTGAINECNINIDKDIEFYLVNLMCHFIDPNPLEINGEKIDIFEIPLALLLKEAQEASPDKQISLYKSIGDTSLYLSGYFQDFFDNKSFDISYFAQLGTGAYASIAEIAQERSRDLARSSMYRHLAVHFEDLVDVLATISDEMLGNSQCSKNLVQIYERWTRNQSTRLKKILEDSGIVPLPVHLNKSG